jgi:AraC-like DNA-binding protein
MIDIVVADPCATGTIDVESIELIRRHFPSLPVVVYTSLSANAFGAIVRLAKSGIEHVVLSRFDDEPRRFLELLESIPAHELGERMLRELAGPLSCLPVVVVRGIDQMFRSPARFTSAGDLAVAAGMNLRTLYRNLEPAGFYSARALVVSARLLRAYAYLRDPGRSIKDVAAKTGYTTPWQLSQHMREMTGRTAEQVRRDTSPDELIGVLVEQVQQRRHAE